MDIFIAMGFENSAIQSALDASQGNSELAMEILLGAVSTAFPAMVGKTTDKYKVE